jgi:hypothetical protein
MTWKPVVLSCWMAACAPLLSGCFGGLRVAPVATSVQPPSNVAVYMSVTKNGEPVHGLFERNFQISEDGKDLTAEQTRQTLLPRDIAVVHRALLLVDMSGAVTEGDLRQRIATAAAKFVTHAHESQPVTVFAFDGAAAPRLIHEFPQGTDEVTDIPELSAYTPGDPSSNLNGAVAEAVAQLEARLMSTQKPLRIGTLVVFARGPDLAGRVSEDKLDDVLDDSKDLVFAIAIKDTGFRPGRLGRQGVFTAESAASLESAFEEAGKKVAGAVDGYYLLSYCSPARAGTRHFRIKVVTADEKGNEESGSMSDEFDAAGFGSGCDPADKPRFVVRAKASDDDDHASKADNGSKAGSTAPRASQKPAGAAPATEDEGDAVVPPPAKPGYAQ